MKNEIEVPATQKKSHHDFREQSQSSSQQEEAPFTYATQSVLFDASTFATPVAIQ
jgi:hypothetical protein